jgi:hypothetical protein
MSEDRGMPFKGSARNHLDPLDLEILERAFDASWEALKTSRRHYDAEADEELEAALRRELIEIVRANGVSDPEALKNILLARIPSLG